MDLLTLRLLYLKVLLSVHVHIKINARYVLLSRIFLYLRDIHSCERTQQPSRLLCFEEKIFFSSMAILIPLGSYDTKLGFRDFVRFLKWTNEDCLFTVYAQGWLAKNNNGTNAFIIFLILHWRCALLKGLLLSNVSGMSLSFTISY